MTIAQVAQVYSIAIRDLERLLWLAAADVGGGTHRAASFANQIGVSGDVNWERLAGITVFRRTSVRADVDTGDRDAALLAGRVWGDSPSRSPSTTARIALAALHAFEVPGARGPKDARL
jgi:hypothetical protein